MPHKSSYRKATRAQGKVHRVLFEYKQGALKSSSGQKVTSRAQAVAKALSVMEEMGIPAKVLVGELKALVKSHTVTTGDGGKPMPPDKHVHPTREQVEGLASKLVTSAHLAGVEAWVEKQLAAAV